LAYTFDLTSEPWIPVETGHGVTDVSLVDALGKAHEFLGLAGEMPTMVPALLRQVLLPILLDALSPPRSEEEWGDRWRTGRFDVAAIGAYLEQHRDRFDLFSVKQPFAQVAGLSTARGEVKASSLLVPAIATGNNVPLFTARTEGDPVRLTFAQAARWLLHAHCWDTAAIKSGAVGDPAVKNGKTTANPVGALGKLGVVVLLGDNLFQTLMLNLRVLPSGLEPIDLPQWRRPPATAAWSARPAAGLLDLLTWQSRRIRLIPEDGGASVVTSVVLAAGDRLPATPEDEPHTAWVAVNKPEPGQAPWRPRRHDSGKAAWRGLDSLLTLRGSEGTKRYSTSLLLEQIARLEASELPDEFPLRVQTVGVEYGNQSAVVENVVFDEVPLPVAALRDNPELRLVIEECASEAENLADAIDYLDGDLRRAAGGEPTPWNQGQRPGTLVIQQLDPVMRRVLAGLSNQPWRVDEARDAWRATARRIVQEIARHIQAAAPPTAYRGRKDDRNHLQRVAIADLRFRRRLSDVLGSVTGDAATDRSIKEAV